MGTIQLLFGEPTTPEREENIEEWIYDCGINRETAVILKFKSLINSLSKKNKEGDNYFELIVQTITGESVNLPKISFGTHHHRGFVLPKIVIHNFYMIKRDLNQRTLIDCSLLEQIGSEFEWDFAFEFYSFHRIGKAEAGKKDVIYQLQNKPHIHHSGEFLEVKKGG